LKPSGNAPTADGQFLVSDATTANKYVNFGEFGQFQLHEQYGNIYDAPFGASFIAGTITNLPDAATHGHIIKMSIGSEYPDQATYLSFKRPFLGGFDGLYVRGVYGGEDSGWLKIGGDVQTYRQEFAEYSIARRGIYYESEVGTKEAFIGIDAIEGGLFWELNIENKDDSTIKTHKNIMSIEDGRMYFVGDGLNAVKYLLEGEGGGTGGTSYTFEEPLYPEGTAVKVRRANNSTTGVLTSTDWATFNGKQNALQNANGTVSGILTNTDWTIFNNKLGQGSTVTSFLDFTGQGLYFNKNPSSNFSDGAIKFVNGVFRFDAIGLNTALITGNLIELKSNQTLPSSGNSVDVDISRNSSQAVVKINGSKLNFYNPITPSDGAKFVLEYNATEGVFYMKPI
jgi:hypothetical protein